MFFGGWLYPDALSTGVADAALPFDEAELGCEFDCAARG